MSRFIRTLVVSVLAGLGLLVIYRWFDEPEQQPVLEGEPEDALSDESTEALIKELEAQL